MNDVNILTIDTLKKYAPEIDLTAYDNPTISGMIAYASGAVADYLQYSPFAEDIADEVKNAYITTDGDLLIYPDKLPVKTVSAIAIVKGTTTIDLTLTSGANNRYNIDHTKRTIRYPNSELTVAGTVLMTSFYQLKGLQFYTKISYRGGWEVSELPDDLIFAAINYIKDYLAQRFNQAGAVRVSQGPVSMEFDRSGKSLFVKRAETLLGPYRRVG